MVNKKIALYFLIEQFFYLSDEYGRRVCRPPSVNLLVSFIVVAAMDDVGILMLIPPRAMLGGWVLG